MFGLIVLLLIVVPIVELYVLLQVADSFGWATSLLSLLAVSVLGAVLMRWQTAGAFQRITDRIQQGQMPSRELVDGALMIFGGALLLTPGFFTDIVGLAMFIPPLRAIARSLVLRRLNARMTTFAGSAASSFPGSGMGAGFANGGFAARPNPRSRSGAIDVEEVHVEKIDDNSPISPTTPPESP